MANRKGKGRSARTSSAGSKNPTPPPPDAKTPSNKRPKRSRPKRAKGRRPTSIPPNWFTRADLPPKDGELSLKLPTDYVVCMNGLARLHGRTLLQTFKATLWSYLKLTRADQRRAMNLEPAMPAQEIAAWGGVHSDGRLLPWSCRDHEQALEILNDDNRLVRVVIRHLPAEPGIKPRGWKE
jgi:hypothetical protein